MLFVLGLGNPDKWSTYYCDGKANKRLSHIITAGRSSSNVHLEVGIAVILKLRESRSEELSIR